MLKDVARTAGVSVGTTSRVINKHPSVSEEKRNRVLKAIDELGYKCNAIAKSLKMQKTKTIGVIIPDIANEYYADIVRGAEDIASKADYSIILCNTDCKEKNELATIKMLAEKQVDGIIMITYKLTPKTSKQLIDTGLPYVMVSTHVRDKNIVSVNISNDQAAYDAVQYLISRGHKSIAMITGPLDDIEGGIYRLNGYKRALSDNNIKYDQNLICESDYHFATGYNSMLKLLNRNIHFTAVIAASDYTIIGAAKALKEKNIQIPKDIAIMGFDNLAITEYIQPAITTVEQPRYEMGLVSVKQLLKMVNGEELEEKQIVVNHKLIIRDSTI
jgi:LacI family transcriptional regulator